VYASAVDGSQTMFSVEVAANLLFDTTNDAQDLTTTITDGRSLDALRLADRCESGQAKVRQLNRPWPPGS